MCSKQKMLAFAIFSIIVPLVFLLTTPSGALDILFGALSVVVLFLALLLIDYLAEWCKKKFKIQFRGRYVAAVILVLALSINMGFMISSFKDRYQAIDEGYAIIFGWPLAALSTPGLMLSTPAISLTFGMEASFWFSYVVSALVWLLVYSGLYLLAGKVFPSEQSEPKMVKKKTKKQSRKR